MQYLRQVCLIFGFSFSLFVPLLALIPPILSNTLIVPPILVLAYHAEEGLPYLMLTVGLGEILSAYLLGIALLFALRRRGGHFMGKKP